ncbi:hypothetical protein FGO68_gene7377 [Halteria grandinella]|uniref:Uncharacterized protein n=1 Tax=Halteria grandinella TaxID=5974 RepID=A0A8J8SWK0_HALGN|nr:hypothetical protein FGO68_gene7377 [Halteria grandinella]
MTFELLSGIICGQDTFNVSPQQFSYLQADVNFMQSIDQPQISVQQQLKMGLIGGVPICKLTDYESEFSFKIIYIFLKYQLASSIANQPIELKIAKFSETWPQSKQNITIISFYDLLRTIAHKFKLELTSIQTIGKDMLRIEIKFNKKQSRQLVVFYDGKQTRSMFRICGIKEEQFKYDDSLVIPKSESDHEYVCFQFQ